MLVILLALLSTAFLNVNMVARVPTARASTSLTRIGASSARSRATTTSAGDMAAAASLCHVTSRAALGVGRAQLHPLRRARCAQLQPLRRADRPFLLLLLVHVLCGHECWCVTAATARTPGGRHSLTRPAHCFAGLPSHPDRSDGNDQEEPQAIVAGSDANVCQAPPGTHSSLGLDEPHPPRAACDPSAGDEPEEPHATAAGGSPQATEPSVAKISSVARGRLQRLAAHDILPGGRRAEKGCK